MKTSDFDYTLPQNLIAQFPPTIRGSSRLLVLNRTSGAIKDKKYTDIPDYLQKGDLVIFNDTRVIKARLTVTTQNGANKEIIVLEKHGQNDGWHKHKILYRRKLHVGEILKVGGSNIYVDEICGGGTAIIRCEEDLLKLTDRFGTVPLPPYMHRESTKEDINRYQTIWANEPGSVAAPTASLNMTDKIINKIVNKSVDVGYITLHVGLGTFLPIRTKNVEDHIMHNEYFEIPKSTICKIKNVKNNGGRIIAVGTTVARTLEYSADKLIKSKNGLSGEADTFIYPGYEFKMVDILITNFHAPDSTVLMLTTAFAGKQHLFKAYEHAVKEGYAFLSYGDSMLI